MVESVTKVIGGGTSVFIGEYEHSVDAKGRVIMPAKLRDGIGEKFVLTTASSQTPPSGCDKYFLSKP